MEYTLYSGLRIIIKGGDVQMGIGLIIIGVGVIFMGVMSIKNGK